MLKSYPQEWLLRLRLIELMVKHNKEELLNSELNRLSMLAHTNLDLKHLIEDGLSFLGLSLDENHLANSL